MQNISPIVLLGSTLRSKNYVLIDVTNTERYTEYIFDRCYNSSLDTKKRILDSIVANKNVNRSM